MVVLGDGAGANIAVRWVGGDPGGQSRGKHSSQVGRWWSGGGGAGANIVVMHCAFWSVKNCLIFLSF